MKKHVAITNLKKNKEFYFDDVLSDIEDHIEKELEDIIEKEEEKLNDRLKLLIEQGIDLVTIKNAILSIHNSCVDLKQYEISY